MKKLNKAIFLSVILIACLGLSSYVGISDKKVLVKNTVVKGNVTHTFSYCGGVAPSQEQMNELAKPKPYADKKFYVRSGSKNSIKEKVVLSFITDKDGKFSFELPMGTYSIIQEWQLKELTKNEYADEYHAVDKECLRSSWSKPYYLLDIKNQPSIVLNFTFHQDCFLPEGIPCIRYTGSYPP